MPGLVWKYHAERRVLALAAKPNKAHEALAVLAKKKAGVRVLTQNIDGKCQIREIFCNPKCKDLRM